MVISPISFSLGQEVRINSAREKRSSGTQPLFLQMSAFFLFVRFLVTGMNFHKHIQGISTLSEQASRVELLGQFDAVDTFNHPKVGNLADQLIALSALQMSDQVPFNILGEDLRFLHKLLDIVFTKVAMTVIVQLLDVFGGLQLAYGNNTRLWIKRRMQCLQQHGSTAGKYQQHA